MGVTPPSLGTGPETAKSWPLFSIQEVTAGLDTSNFRTAIGPRAPSRSFKKMGQGRQVGIGRGQRGSRGRALGV